MSINEILKKHNIDTELHEVAGDCYITTVNTIDITVLIELRERCTPSLKSVSATQQGVLLLNF